MLCVALKSNDLCTVVHSRILSIGDVVTCHKRCDNDCLTGVNMSVGSKLPIKTADLNTHCSNAYNLAFVYLAESYFSGRKSLLGNKLRYQNVAVNDSQVIQCMAANEHGSILTNVILKVNGLSSELIVCLQS